MLIVSKSQQDPYITHTTQGVYANQTGMADQITKNPHAIFIPLPLQGHLIPSVHLAVKLASKGFTITFINTESVHHSITNSSSSSNLFEEACKSGLDIRYATVSDGLPVEFDRSLNHDQFMECLFHVFSAHVDKLVGSLVKDDPSIGCLIADSFCVWPLMISKKYKLVNISFWTEPALVLNLYHHLDLLKKNGHYDPLDKFDDAIDYIPGVGSGSIKPTDLMSYLQATNTNTILHRIIHKALFQNTKSADIIICNTIQELEPYTISTLNQTQPFYAIGPIFPNDFTKELVSTSLWCELDCTRWLDNKPPGSVLYVSFGSYAHTSKHVLEEIACGLLQSEVSFVWVLRPDLVSSTDTNALPVGFEDQVKDQGLIVPWCNQKAVISHQSVGGFLTHCGWNSILESIWCGVPMICLPLLTDQFTNRKLVVDDWKIGINLCEKNLVDREEVTKKVKELMMQEKSNELRTEVKKVKRTLQDALATGGSSHRNLDHFVSQVILKTNQVK
ncbi:putative cyanohydrin beta-glucosyltransferase [Helianthus annuus]|uniref:Glycosyltransferase n=1 Tax=Helianthus annuus TaxID=4232 RepID=A0A9K3EC30_HELAN|nr:UDP-glycosyltransferase 86A1-like [Helianthus annuus]KAF5770399.1 putative cyanohydrin beta-glucosyltransferase [Helianthus annuus]KAJ0486910.1 putative cyanohydrin beta-glucosyltransferase [Helianthus annuus]